MAREQVRFGGRSARIQAEVHKAVEELSGEVERSELTVPMIATRAGVTPSTIYRRWGDLSELLADVAVQRLRPISDPEDTGAAKSDVEAWVMQYMEEMSSSVGRALLRDVFAQSGAYAEQCWKFTYMHLNTLADRARGRGEVPFDVDEVVDQVVAPITFHILFGDRELSVEYCQGLLQKVRFP
jgi:AcrR family transcriptional regulator